MSALFAVTRVRVVHCGVSSYCSKKLPHITNNFNLFPQLSGLDDLIPVAELIVRCALLRKESRGLHYSLNYPPQQQREYPTIQIPVF